MENVIFLQIQLTIMTAKTAQNHCCTRNGPESPDLQHASSRVGIETFYTLLVQLGRSTIHFHPCTHKCSGL